MVTKTKKKAPSTRLCKLTMCEDPKTGKIVVKGSKGCPKGYIEKVKQKVIQEGIYFPEGSYGRLPESRGDHAPQSIIYLRQSALQAFLQSFQHIAGRCLMPPFPPRPITWKFADTLGDGELMLPSVSKSRTPR